MYLWRGADQPNLIVVYYVARGVLWADSTHGLRQVILNNVLRRARRHRPLLYKQPSRRGPGLRNADLEV